MSKLKVSKNKSTELKLPRLASSSSASKTSLKVKGQDKVRRQSLYKSEFVVLPPSMSKAPGKLDAIQSGSFCAEDNEDDDRPIDYVNTEYALFSPSYVCLESARVLITLLCLI